MRNEAQAARFRRPRALGWIFLAAVFGILAYLGMAAPKGPEAAVSAAVERLRLGLLMGCRAGADSGDTRQLGQLVLPEAQLRVAGRLIQERGAGGILRFFAELQVNAITLEIRSQELALSPDKTSARAFLEVRATGQRAGATRIEERRVNLRFEDRGRGFQLADLEILPKARNYPEARP